MAQSSDAQNLGQRRFLLDQSNLSPDELDSLMSSSGKKSSVCVISALQSKAAVGSFFHVVGVTEVLVSDAQTGVLSLWCTVFLN